MQTCTEWLKIFIGVKCKTHHDRTLMSAVETFQSYGYESGSACAVFFVLVFFQSLIKHLCKNIELVLTEHKALCRAEVVLTATSPHQIYTCTHIHNT